MTDRMKATIGFLLYMFLCSVFFGTLFGKEYLLIGLMALGLAQVIALYIILLVEKTEPR